MMKFLKIFLILMCFFGVSLSAEQNLTNLTNEANQTSQKNNSFYLIQEFVSLNKKLKEEADNNKSSPLYSQTQSLKNEILMQIPSFIVNQKVDAKAVERFFEKRAELEDTKNKTKNNFVFIETSLDIAYMDSIEVFFSALKELENLFKNVESSDKMIKVIDKALDELASIDITNLEERKAKITNYEQESVIKAKQDRLETSINSYMEILKYLKNNANLLESNYIFSTFKLQNYIDLINTKYDFTFGNEMINAGKITISLLVLIFFLSLRSLLTYLLYIVSVRLIYKKSLEETKDLFIKNIKKPVGYLLLVYALSLCATIIFYPAPVFVGISNIFSIVYAGLFAWLAFGILDGYGIVLISKIAQKSGKKEVVNLIIKILYFVIIIIALLFILARLGFNVSAIIASLGIGGLAVALAAKDIIANFFASILLLFDDSFNQGDWVEVGGVEGTVVETGLRKTTIRTFDNSLVFLPNSSIMAANIKNWSKRRIGRHVRMYLGVEYSATPEQLEKVVNDLKAYLNASPLVANADDSGLKAGVAKYKQNLVSINDLEGYKNACYVALSEFGDSSINIELYFYTKAISAKDFREARQTLMLDFMRIIEKNNLSFAFPSRTIYVKNLD